MKKIITFFTAMLLLVLTEISFAQISVPPQAFNYQAVLRNNIGNPMPNQNVSLRFSIIDSTAGFVDYVERHDTITNAFGAISLEIGRGTVISGIFNNIPWGFGEHYLKTEIDTSGSGSYTTMGVSQLISVPYAMYAQYAGPWQFSGPPSSPYGIPPSLIWFVGNEYTCVAIGCTTPEPRAVLEISASDKGILIPRMTTGQRLAIDTSSIPLAIRGLLVYDIDYEQFMYFNGTNWTSIINGNIASNNYWTKTGNNLNYNSGNIGIGTATPHTPLQVSTGDVYIENIGSGVIMKSPNGNCWRMTVDNSGNPVFTAITCP